MKHILKSEDISPNTNNFDLIKKIKNIKQEKNAALLVHYYQDSSIQEIADYLGDSLYLAKIAKNLNSDIIVLSGVHFMAETVKIINPEKKILLPDLKAGCSLADSCPPKLFKSFIRKHPEAVVVSYINCSAEIKAMSDIICTSSNAKAVIDSIPEDKQIIFAPDKNLGNYLIKETKRDMILWDGSCVVHEAFSFDKILDLFKKYPKAKFIAHPESKSLILEVANYVGSTSKLLEYVQNSGNKEFIVATEAGILHEMNKRCPDKLFIPAPVEDSSCACSECSFMKLNTLEKLYLCLKYEKPEITLTEEIISKAKAPLLKMLSIS
ncbi:MAG: quinolinate synthase NadA [Flavobacteriales bacterium]|nr:MAG: quinolinate synthase NadA [Flavobacteriales bacterium]|tara:strand:- start:3008 stop:3976 length:969 start_codon:yes stop_codon:yes gene_type:complete